MGWSVKINSILTDQYKLTRFKFIGLDLFVESRHMRTILGSSFVFCEIGMRRLGL